MGCKARTGVLCARRGLDPVPLDERSIVRESSIEPARAVLRRGNLTRELDAIGIKLQVAALNNVGTMACAMLDGMRAQGAPSRLDT